MSLPVLCHGDPAGLVVELLPGLGGRVYRIHYRGHDLLRTPDDTGSAEREPFWWSGFVMAPWCNRIPGARMHTPQGPVSLAANFDDGSAIHGLVHTRGWSIDDRHHLHLDADRIGVPWRYRVEAELFVGGSTLRYTLSLRNTDTVPMPAGLGWHPWFAADRASLTVSGSPAARYRVDSRFLPVGEPIAMPPADGRCVSLTPAPDEQRIYTRLRPRRVLLHWLRRQLRAELSFSAAADDLVLFHSASLDAIAVEPQTHTPDGHRRAVDNQSGGIGWLAPGQTLSVTYRLTAGPEKPGLATQRQDSA